MWAGNSCKTVALTLNIYTLLLCTQSRICCGSRKQHGGKWDTKGLLDCLLEWQVHGLLFEMLAVCVGVHMATHSPTTHTAGHEMASVFMHETYRSCMPLRWPMLSYAGARCRHEATCHQHASSRVGGRRCHKRDVWTPLSTRQCVLLLFTPH